MLPLSMNRWMAAALLACAPLLASAVTLDFEVEREGPADSDIYQPPGFSISNGFIFIDADSTTPGRSGTGNFGRAPSRFGALTLYRDAGASEGVRIDVAQGFQGSVSFSYSTFESTARVTVLGANNEVLAQSGTNADPLLTLDSDPAPFKGKFKDEESGSYNKWETYTLSFQGTAQSLVFDGDVGNPAGGKVVGRFFIDDVVLSPVPEASTVAMLLAGLAAVGVATRRRRG